MNVTKRNGTVEEINLDKIHKVVDWAAEGLDVSVSQVEIDAQIQFFEGIKTSQIHDTLIRAAAEGSPIRGGDARHTGVIPFHG